ncbi:MAG TPA: serine/threonine-protein kinase [Vicinamibacteria bacterium]|nr:serine/threonine-protein kinase [Vicinamibacteria bacterium]
MVLEPLGAGGMGTIHKGAVVGQSGFQRPVVIKKLREAGDPAHVRMFVEEARRYALLDHENIGRIFDFELVGGELSIILEFIDGWSLVEYLERHHQLSRRPDTELSIFIASRVCRALQYVYERASIVHRDISPSNIMMTREGTVKLIDFGIATRAGSRDSGLTGKPAYMAPEMIVELRADNRSDVFSLGAVLYELLAGERLFQGDTTSEVLEQVVAGTLPSPKTKAPGLPDAVLAILNQALERSPAKRFASAAEMGAACEHYLYDKGYGPTNLALKQYLGELFPMAAPPVPAMGEAFPELEPTLLPLGEAATLPPGDPTPVSRPRPPGVAARGRRIVRSHPRR